MTMLDLGPDGVDAELEEVTEAELEALALAADPTECLDPDAVPLGDGRPFGELLPSWYMPSPVMSTRKRWHVVLATLTVAGFVVINMAGLCITYGHLVVA